MCSSECRYSISSLPNLSYKYRCRSQILKYIKWSCFSVIMDEPTWLNEPLFENVLQNIEKNKTIAVSGITIKPATAKGDNYTSDMYRVSVTFLRIVEGQKISETKSFVAKVAPQGGSREEMVIRLVWYLIMQQRKRFSQRKFPDYLTRFRIVNFSISKWQWCRKLCHIWAGCWMDLVEYY